MAPSETRQFLAVTVRARQVFRVLAGLTSPALAKLTGSPVGPPLDMLRYDNAFFCEKWPDIVVFVAGYVHGRGSLSGNPTIERWNSFGCPLERVDEKHHAAILKHMDSHPTQWNTYVGRDCTPRNYEVVRHTGF